MVPTHFGRQTIVRHFFFYLSVCPFSVCSLSIGSGPDCASLTSFFVCRTSSGATPSPTTKQQQQQQQPISHNSAIAQLSLHPLPPPPFAFPPPPFAYPPPHFAVSLFLRGQKPSSAPLFCLFVVPSTTVWSFASRRRDNSLSTFLPHRATLLFDRDCYFNRFSKDFGVRYSSLEEEEVFHFTLFCRSVISNR